MKVGDLVRYIEPTRRLWPEIGIVTKVHPWTDPGAPDRNFGITIHVLWPDGDIASHDECDLEVINETR